MSDKVKLIIEIDENTYKDIKKGKVYSSVRDVPQESVLAIAHGIPLDSVKAEIKEHRDSWEKDGYYDEADALNIALKIIDKYIGKAESEVNNGEA